MLWVLSTEKASWEPSLYFSTQPLWKGADPDYSIVVEFAKESRPKRDTYDVDRAVRARRPPGYRLVVSGISRDTSWQVWISPFWMW